MEKRLDALLSSSPPLCSASRASCCFGGGGGGCGNVCAVACGGGCGLLVGIVSSSGYGAITGIDCAALLDMEESEDMSVLWLSNLGGAGPGPRLGDSLVSFLLVVLGGRSGPTTSLLPDLCRLALISWLIFRSGKADVWLSIESCRDVAPARSPSRAALARSFACFFLRPWSRLIIMSRIRGRYLSKLACDASCDSVSSNIDRSKSGTGPRSVVSTPIELKLRHAALNQFMYSSCTTRHCTDVELIS